ncbi:MAG: LysM peptidoglycan-binding domain-containing protein [Rhodopirellula sp.]|nr:LysM peptidoglycan-binding domain-containing protein [Rhodopirellula sp.]
MTDKYETEDEEYEDEEATSESEEAYEDEAEASDESAAGSEGDDSVASWGYEEKKSRFSKEMLAGFAAIGVLVAIFGVVVYKKMPGSGDTTEVVNAAPDASLGNPESGSPAADPNDPFAEGTDSNLGVQSEPGFGEGSSDELVAGGNTSGFNSTDNGSTNFGSNGNGGGTDSLFPGDPSSGQPGSNDPFGSNTETANLFPGQPASGAGTESADPFGTSPGTDVYGQPLASNVPGSVSADPTGSLPSNPDPFADPTPMNNGRRDVFGGPTSEFADAGTVATDPFTQPDLSDTAPVSNAAKSSVASSSDPLGSYGTPSLDNSLSNPGLNDGSSSGFADTGSASDTLFPKDTQLVQNEPAIDGAPGSDSTSDLFGSQPESMTDKPFEITTDAGNSRPGGLFDRGPAAGSEFGSVSNGSTETGSAFDSGLTDASPDPLGMASPTGTTLKEPFSDAASDSAADLNSGSSFDGSSPGSENLFPDSGPGNSPIDTAANDPFQPPLTSTPDNSFPSGSSATSSVPIGSVPNGSGPIGSEPFNTESSRNRTFASQPVNSGTYTVQEGDSYWNISRKVYGTAKYFQVLADHNSKTIPDPQKMKTGVVVQTPDASVLQARLKTVTRTAPTALAGRIDASGRADRAASSGSSGSASSFQGLTDRSVVVNRRSEIENEPSGILFNEQGYPMFRIGESDTLTSIASDHLGRASRWQQVYNMNRDQLQSPDKLQIGMLLKLPADASRVPLVDQTSSLR